MSKAGVGVTIAILLAGDMAVRYVDARQAHKPPSVLTAQEFRLVGKQGELRAKVGTNAKDETGVWIYDKAGKKAKAQLLVNANAGANLTLLDSAGRERVALNIVETPKSGSVAMLTLGGTGKGAILLTTISSGNKNASMLGIYNDSNKAQALLGPSEDGGGSLTLYDKEGKQVWPEP